MNGYNTATICYACGKGTNEPNDESPVDSRILALEERIAALESRVAGIELTLAMKVGEIGQ